MLTNSNFPVVFASGINSLLYLLKWKECNKQTESVCILIRLSNKLLSLIVLAILHLANDVINGFNLISVLFIDCLYFW